MTSRLSAIAVLLSAGFLIGCADSRKERFITDLSPIVEDRTAQKLEAVELVDRAFLVYYDEGRREEDRVVQAAGLLEQAIRIDPGFATAHMNLGVLHLEQENLPMAIGYLRNAQRLMPGDARPGYFLGVTYYRMGHPRPAIDTFVEALRIDPSNLDAVRGLVLACRSVFYADDVTLEILERAQFMEPDEEWRQLIDREITRQSRQLEMG